MSRGPRRRVIGTRFGTMHLRPTNRYPGGYSSPWDVDTLSCWHEVPCYHRCRSFTPHRYRYCAECARLPPEEAVAREERIRRTERDLLDIELDLLDPGEQP